jgi:hypothetical protein
VKVFNDEADERPVGVQRCHRPSGARISHASWASGMPHPAGLYGGVGSATLEGVLESTVVCGFGFVTLCCLASAARKTCDKSDFCLHHQPGLQCRTQSCSRC